MNRTLVRLGNRLRTRAVMWLAAGRDAVFVHCTGEHQCVLGLLRFWVCPVQVHLVLVTGAELL